MNRGGAEFARMSRTGPADPGFRLGKEGANFGRGGATLFGGGTTGAVWSFDAGAGANGGVGCGIFAWVVSWKVDGIECFFLGK